MMEQERVVYVRRVEWSGLLRTMYDGLERDFPDRVDVLPLLAEWKRRTDEGMEEDVESEVRGWAVYEARLASGEWWVDSVLAVLEAAAGGARATTEAVQALTQQLETVTERL